MFLERVLVPGDYQPASAALSAVGAVTPAANRLLGFDGSEEGKAYTPAEARTLLGATVAGDALFRLTNPSAVTFLRVNADNTVSALSAADFRTALGGTTVGQSLFTAVNPSAVSFPRANADNTVSFLSAADYRTALGLGSLATQSGTFSGTHSGSSIGTNTGDQFTDMASSRLLGRGGAGGPGLAEEITLGAGLSMSGTTLTVDAPNALEFKGNLDCSANPNYPAGAVGDTYYVNVAGKVGGASGTTVEVGDAVLCKADNAGGTEASVGASWCVLQKNLNVAAVALSGLASDLSGGPLRLSDGSASAPTYAFSGATGTGVYRDGTSLGLSVAGSRRVRLTTADQIFFGADEGDRPTVGPDTLLSDCIVTYKVSSNTAFTGDANNAVINSYNGSLFIHRTATAADEFLFFQGRLTVNGGSAATGQVDVNVGAASRTGVIVTQHATPGYWYDLRNSSGTGKLRTQDDTLINWPNVGASDLPGLNFNRVSGWSSRLRAEYGSGDLVFVDTTSGSEVESCRLLRTGGFNTSYLVNTGDTVVGTTGGGVKYYTARRFSGGAAVDALIFQTYKSDGSQYTNRLTLTDGGPNDVAFVRLDNAVFCPASLADANAPNSSLYYSTTAGKLVWKDAGGVVNNLY